MIADQWLKLPLEGLDDWTLADAKKLLADLIAYINEDENK